MLAPAALAVEGDVKYSRKAGPGDTPPAVFPHWAHRLRYRCYACHPTPFAMSKGTPGVTMDAIQEGKSCGRCHDGKAAWGVAFDTCGRCHPGR